MNDMDWKKRADIFWNSNNAVHIVTKKDTWINGYIARKPEDSVVHVHDRKLGVMPVFYEDIQTMDFFLGDLSTLPKVEGKNGQKQI